MPITTPWKTTDLGAFASNAAAVASGAFLMRWRRVEGRFHFIARYKFGADSTVQTALQLVTTTDQDMWSIPIWWGGTNYSGSTGDEVLGVVPCVAYRPLSSSGGPGSVVILGNNVAETGRPGACDATAVPYFGTAKWTSSNPFTWQEGDALIFGNALDAFDN